MLPPGHTYRADRYQAGDDSFRIEILVQMADSASASATTQWAVSVGAKVGPPIVFTNLTVAMQRAASDAPDISLTFTTDTTQTYGIG